MPPNNTNSRKSNEAVEVRLALEERRPSKCHSKEETSLGKIHSNGIGHSKSQTDVKGGGDVPHRNRSVCSLMDELLGDIYSKMEVKRRTSATTCDFSWQDSDCGRCPGSQVRCPTSWKWKDVPSLKAEKARLERLIAEEGNNLVKQLKRKNYLLVRREAHYDVITAYIQAVSTKTREDTKMKFSLTPGAETGFSQWLDAMKMVAQLPGGMPSEFRTKLWLQLSEKHLNDQNVDWEKAEAVIFNEWTNPDDEELGVQIVKDLHRTGCSLFCGEQEHNQALLKRVLLAYARWNKNVGYCQGFNMLAALILQVMDKDERNAVKVMIYLIEGVLPESYFANNLRGLSVDMAVFRDLLRLRLPKLSKHLDALQHDTNAGTSYEPPLTNVFTMQWFLTLFSNCLPQQTVLRVWDLVFLYGNEVLLRTALAIWGVLQDRVITVESADEFYSIMGVVTREMLEFGLMDANALVKMIAMVDPFPNELQELREKYLYNISPWTQSVHSAAKKGIRLFYSDPDDQDDTEDEDKIALATAYGVFRRRESTSKELQLSGPTLDISVLKQQYAKLRQRQRQAHVIITAACSSNLAGTLTGGPSVSVNHLLMGKSALINKGRRIGPPEGSIPPPNNKKGEEKEEKRPRVVISGETFHWKDAEKRKMSKPQNRNKSNKQVMKENEKNRGRLELEGSRFKTNHDRMEGVSQESVEDSLRRKASSSGSSSSSTSTELCDDETHRMSDFDSDDATRSDASALGRFGASPKASPSRGNLSPNGGCDRSNYKEIKSLAINLVNEIEEKIQTSGKLAEGRRLRDGNREEEERKREEERVKREVEKAKGEEEEEEEGKREGIAAAREFDNTKNLILDADLQIKRDNILKPEPEVPTCENVIIKTGIGSPKGGKVEKEGEREVEEEAERWKNRRKSDLALSVIKENLEMLSRYSQKGVQRADSQPEKKTEKDTSNDMMWFDEEKEVKDGGGRKEFVLPLPKDAEIGNCSKTEAQDEVRAKKNFLVEKAISPMVDKTPKTIKVNKEVNTELTFGVDEVEISTKQPKYRTETLDRFRGSEEEIGPTSRKSRESLFREKDEMKQRIETSKSDWELKMRKIAELETTTRETLNEIQARSAHRKSLHRSLDRNTRRTYLDDDFKPKSPERTFSTKIQLEPSNSIERGMDSSPSRRKSKTSALSFYEITSRTEKLLGNHPGEETSSISSSSYRASLSPELDSWRPKDSTSKFRKLIEESFGDEPATPSFGFSSSPTSPEYRTRSNIRYGEYLRPRKYEEVLRVTQGGSRTSVEMFDRRYSPERRKPDAETESHRSSFNPFPTRSVSRPKELGVKLGLYPTSPETQTKKS